jgi:hypothetical protein
MDPLEAVHLDGRWVGLSVEGRDIGYVSFRAERVGRGLEWTRSGPFGRIRLLGPSVEVYEEHWSVKADGGVVQNVDGWDDYLDDWDAVNFLDQEADAISPLGAQGTESPPGTLPFNVRWLTEAEKSVVLSRIGKADGHELD